MLVRIAEPPLLDAKRSRQVPGVEPRVHVCPQPMSDVVVGTPEPPRPLPDWMPLEMRSNRLCLAWEIPRGKPQGSGVNRKRGLA